MGSLSKQLSFCEVYKDMLKAGMDEVAVVRKLADELERPKVQVKAAVAQEEKWLSTLSLLGHTEKGTLSRGQAQLPQYLRKKRSAGVKRAKGGGRKSYVSFLYDGVKHWFDEMRTTGQWVDKVDLVNEWCELARLFLRRVALKEAAEGLSVTDKLRQAAVKSKLELVEAKPKAHEKFQKVLQLHCGARFRKPQRVAQLSPLEEEKRAEATWRCYDKALFDTAFGDEACHAKLFANVEQARANLKHTSLIYSDEVPFWIKIGASKQLYSENELRRRSKKAMTEKTDEEFTQLRSKAHSEADRFRVTLELVQVVRGYFDEAVEPKGEIGKSALILIGVHARLSNISDEETWIKDEHFTVGGKEVLRKAGQSTKGVMRTWVELRRESEEVRNMLKHVDIYQQPSGFNDSITMSWMHEELSREHVVAIHQRDMFGAALSSDAQKAAFLSHSVSTFVSGKMTSVLQLTDTDLSFPVKRAADRMKAELRKTFRADSLSSGQPAPAVVVGPFEMLKIAHAAHEYQVKLNSENDTVLCGLRRNGMLSYRPSLSQGCLVRSDTQKWAKDKPEGNHRMPKKWLRNRYEWRDEAGVPLPPQWSECGGGVKELADMADAPDVEGGRVVLKSWAGDVELKAGVPENGVVLEFDGEDLSLDTSWKAMREAIDSERKGFVMSSLMTKQHQDGKQKALQAKREQRAMMRKLSDKMIKKWKSEQRAQLDNYSREQLLEALIPGASKRNKNGKRSEKTKGSKVRVKEGF